MGFVLRTEKLTRKQGPIANKLLFEHAAFCESQSEFDNLNIRGCFLEHDFSANGFYFQYIGVIRQSCYDELRRNIKEADWIDNRSRKSLLNKFGVSTPWN